MAHTVFLIIFFTSAPVFIIYLTSKSTLANKIGSIIIAYALGLILGNCGLLPRASENYRKLAILADNNGSELNIKKIDEWIEQGKIQEDDRIVYRIEKMQEIFTGISILLAIPLLLFSMKIGKWFRMAGKTLLSMFLAILSVSIVITLGYFILHNRIKELDKIAGLLVGLYTGGTPNLAALKLALNVDADTYILTHTYDTLLSLMYLLFLISFGKHIFRAFLPEYPAVNNNHHFTYSENGYEDIFNKKILKNLAVALFAAIIIFGIAMFSGNMVKDTNMMTVVVLTITSMGILCSFIPYIHNIKKSFELGMYFILVFSIVIASMADVHKFADISFYLFFFIAFVLFGSLLLHTLFARIFGIDADTLMVSSVALTCSPPFVPVVAGALKNKEIIMSGLTVGIIGYALGNYLGILISRLLILL